MFQSAVETEPQPATRSVVHVLVVVTAGHEFVVDVGAIREIIQPETICPMPGTPDHVAGAVRRHGRILPLVDLKKRLGLPGRSATDAPCAVVTEMPFGPVGLLVDQVTDLLHVETREFEPPSPVLAGIDRRFLRGLAHAGTRLLVLLDVRAVVSPDGLEEGNHDPEVLRSGDESGRLDDESGSGDPGGPAPGTTRLLVFELSREQYGVSVDQVVSVCEILPMMPVPNVPDYVSGLVNLRGIILPVIDLRRRFRLPIGADTPENRLVVVKGDEYQVALRADSVHGFAFVNDGDTLAAPSGVLRIDSEYHQQISLWEGRLLIELNVRKLLDETAGGGREGSLA